MRSYAAAPATVSQRFLKSNGVRSTLFEFIAPLQVAQSQILSRNFYEDWIGGVQTRLRLPGQPFLFCFNNGSDRGKFFGYYDMAKNRLVNKHIFKERVLGCIQVRTSLFVCIDRLPPFEILWRSFTDLDQETAREKTLKNPFFTRRRQFSLANFSDQLIFLIGGCVSDSGAISNEVFYYKI